MWSEERGTTLSAKMKEWWKSIRPAKCKYVGETIMTKEMNTKHLRYLTNITNEKI